MAKQKSFRKFWRKNGWSLPPDPLQFGAWFAIALVMSYTYCCLCPAYLENFRPIPFYVSFAYLLSLRVNNKFDYVTIAVSAIYARA